MQDFKAEYELFKQAQQQQKLVSQELEKTHEKQQDRGIEP